MKTLTNHTLLYDQDCPLCHWYTNLFLKYKLLDENGRIAFQEVDEANFPLVDFELARNKIALVNRINGEVYYGIDSLAKVLGTNFWIVSYFLKFKFIHWFFEQLYNFISYNRKIVIPVSCNKSASCNPSRNWFWRIVFIFFCAVVVNLIVGHYFTRHLSSFFIGNPVYGDSIYFMGQLLFQWIVCLLLGERNWYDYLGHVSFVSFLGALMLGFFGLGLSLLGYFHIQIQLLQPFCYGMVYAWMFLDHRKRLEIADMDWRLTYTWLIYRLMIYPFAFITI
jgi:predicted DCC family thiol-disulfide oxidoreductase YuxK